MKPKHHLSRIISSLIVSGSFILAVIHTEKWILLGIWCLLYQGLCYLIICIDMAKEYQNQ